MKANRRVWWIFNLICLFRFLCYTGNAVMFWSIIGRILKILCYPHTDSLLQLVLKSGFSGRRLISLSDSLLIITFRRDNSLIEFSIAVEIQIQWFQWLPLDFLSAISIFPSKLHGIHGTLATRYLFRQHIFHSKSTLFLFLAFKCFFCD